MGAIAAAGSLMAVVLDRLWKWLMFLCLPCPKSATRACALPASPFPLAFSPYLPPPPSAHLIRYLLFLLIWREQKLQHFLPPVPSGITVAFVLPSQFCSLIPRVYGPNSSYCLKHTWKAESYICNTRMFLYFCALGRAGSMSQSASEHRHGSLPG